ncbi:hypothetical protein BGP_3893 [Beggiatoa sp. PS]|nr:hypothetical protein BGP_3893 [Beggiatoa sp. PS]
MRLSLSISNNKQNQEKQDLFLKFYLIYRIVDDKKDQLRDTIQDYQGQWQYPLLYLIYGNENEYGDFTQCLLEEFLPKDNVLSEHFGGGMFPKMLNIEKFQTVETLHQNILSFLSNELKTVPKKEAIANRLTKEQRAIIFHIRIYTDDLVDWQDEKTIIDGFIEFWKKWPKMLNQRYPFLVFLSVSCENEKVWLKMVALE